MLLPFDKGEMFAASKPAGKACRHLNARQSCTIHATLGDDGYQGCAQFDCLGAGQRLTAAFSGTSWKDHSAAITPMTIAFRVARTAHEKAQLLTLCLDLDPDASLRAEIEALLAQFDPSLARLDHPDGLEAGQSWIRSVDTALRQLPARAPDLAQRIKDLIAARASHT